MTVSGDCQLADGRAVVLRLAGPGDVAAITRLYLQLSAGSFHRRFHGGQPAPAQVARLAGLGSGTVCFVAAPPADPGCLAGEARYVPIGAGTAELALTVTDGYQGAGLGRLLLEALVQRAREEGLKRLRATVLLSNKPMLRLLQRYGWALADATEDFSVACLEISAIGGMPGWPAQSAGQRVLVERRGWFDDERVTALRSAGNDVRQCTGPLREAGRACPLVTSGQCRLAEEAEVIVSLLPDSDPDCAAVLAAHRRRWPHLLAELGTPARQLVVRRATLTAPPRLPCSRIPAGPPGNGSPAQDWRRNPGPARRPPCRPRHPEQHPVLRAPSWFAEHLPSAHVSAVSLAKSISAPSTPIRTHHGMAIFSQSPAAYSACAGRNRAGQPATTGMPIMRPRPTRHARLWGRIFSERLTNGQICMATCTDPASSIAHDNTTSKNNTRSTSRIAAPSRGPD